MSWKLLSLLKCIRTGEWANVVMIAWNRGNCIRFGIRSLEDAISAMITLDISYTYTLRTHSLRYTFTLLFLHSTYTLTLHFITINYY